jgi:hypothetical protein
MNREKKPAKLSAVLRQAVKDSGQHVYDIASGAGLSYSNLMRFLSGDRPLTQAELDLLATYLGLRLVPVKEQINSPAKG